MKVREIPFHTGKKDMLLEYYNNSEQKSSVETTLKEAQEKIKNAHDKARKVMAKSNAEHILYSITQHSENDEIDRIMVFHNTCLSEEELDEYIKRYPCSIFGVLHKGTCGKACKELTRREESREIRPVNLKTANDFVNKHHRHHNGTVGCKFAVGLYELDQLIGVAICGRPVSRHLDDGTVCEVNRLCTLGGNNACSMLYSACANIAKHLGYKKIITYILKSEPGSTLKASGFICEGEAGGTHWTGERNRGQNIPSEMKTRWAKTLNFT